MPRAHNETAIERRQLAMKIKHERRKRGWTMTKLATEANMPDRSRIFKYENMKSTPSIISAKLIARAFSMTLDELLGG